MVGKYVSWAINLMTLVETTVFMFFLCCCFIIILLVAFDRARIARRLF
jgi:hypothetical protein